MDKTRWFIFAGVCIALIGLLIFTRQPSTADFEGDPAKVVQGDHVYGNRDAKVVLIEYGDFGCPGCGSLYPTFKEVKQQYQDKVAFVFRHLPLTNLHPNAKAAATAAVAASQQGKFWEMHDILFERQQDWTSASADRRSEVFEQYAETIGLNMDQYRQDVVSDEVQQRVSRDMSAARKAGIQLSTPTLILNGQNVELKSIQTNGQYDAGKLRELLDGRLREVGEEPPETQSEAPKPNEDTPAEEQKRPFDNQRAHCYSPIVRYIRATSASHSPALVCSGNGQYGR